MRRAHLVALAALLPAALAAPLWGPPLLALTPWFPVSRVEVAGTRIVAPHEVVTASGVRLGESLWADPQGWEERLRGHPTLAGARVSRRLPGTLRIEVREKRPVGLVEAETLRPVTAGGEVLPVDPARIPVDLPLIRVSAPGGRISDPKARALLAEVERLGGLDGGLLARVSEVKWGEEGVVLLTLIAPDARVLLPAGAGSARLRQLRAALEDVEGRLSGATGPVHVDLRYQDQVVVRFPSRA